uniref:mTERF domain-containing protein 1, mitochondrial n=2 Tax=Anthurium amnicola TaxID=1678845 RepID=A0A1D1XE47_9ARAE
MAKRFCNHVLLRVRASPSPPPGLRYLLLSTAAPTPGASPFIAGYLVSSCGLSPEMAARASKYLSHLRTPEKPDAVLSFLRSKGFDDDQIRKTVSARPQVLCADVERTLEPRFRALEELGFGGPALSELINRNSRFLCLRQDRVILPNISTLVQECGIRESRVLTILQWNSWLVCRSASSLKEVIGRAEELGFIRNSRMFEHALCVLAKYSRATVASKLGRFARFGWTEQEALHAVRLGPFVLTLSDEKLRKSMDFLIGEAGLKPARIASSPAVLAYSLEKRVIPRYRVLQFLELRGLREGTMAFSTALRLSERKFLEKFVSPYVETFPELHQAYVPAATPGKSTGIIAV